MNIARNLLINCLFILFVGCVKNTDTVASNTLLTCITGCRTDLDECSDSCLDDCNGSALCWNSCMDGCDNNYEGCMNFCHQMEDPY